MHDSARGRCGADPLPHDDDGNDHDDEHEHYDHADGHDCHDGALALGFAEPLRIDLKRRATVAPGRVSYQEPKTDNREPVVSTPRRSRLSPRLPAPDSCRPIRRNGAPKQR